MIFAPYNTHMRSKKLVGGTYQKITINGLNIDGAGFARIARLIAEGHIHVRVDPEMCVGAQYDPTGSGAA